MTDATRNLLMSFVSGDREAAAAAAKEAVDQYIDAFIFPDDAMDAGLGDALGDEMELPSDDMPGDDQFELSDDDVFGDVDSGMASDQDFDAALGDEVDLELGGDVDPALDPELDPTMESIEDELGSNLDAPLGGEEDEQDPLAGDGDDGVNMDGVDDTLAALSDVPASDVVGIEPVDGEDGAPVATKTVTGIEADPEQGDAMVKAIKMTYDDGTDFTMYTLASEVDKVLAALRDAIEVEPGTHGQELVDKMSSDHPIF
jgi:hypothetical protein